MIGSIFRVMYCSYWEFINHKSSNMYSVKPWPTFYVFLIILLNFYEKWAEKLCQKWFQISKVKIVEILILFRLNIQSYPSGPELVTDLSLTPPSPAQTCLNDWIHIVNNMHTTSPMLIFTFYLVPLL